MKVVATVSGKGGTGKTTISVAMAKALASEYRVGLLDIDVSGANAHKLLNIVETYDARLVDDKLKIEPAIAEVDGRRLQFMSIALVSESYVGWRPGGHGDFVEQMIEYTDWDVDYLILDAPPGTHDDIIRALKYTDVAVLVTIPSELSRLDAERTLQLLSDMEVPVAGQYINFAYVVCPKCGESIRVFRNDNSLNIPVIQEVPFTKGLPDIDVSKLLSAIDRARVYKFRSRSIINRTLIEMFLRGLANVEGEDKGNN